jgi:TonB family protein
MRLCVAAAVLLFESSSAFSQAVQVAHEAAHVVAGERLCDVLASIRDGERRPVTLSGVFVVGYENASFYDPAEPTCRADVQPETWVEFAPGVKNDELDRLFKRKSGDWSPRRAYVRFTGELYGPGVVGPDDLSLLPPLAYANRIRNRRYGHLSGYRTKFVVTGISDVRSVPEATPSPAGRSAPSTLVVEHAEVPRYPRMAWNAAITGDVVVDVTVSDGRVSKVEAKSGDRMLCDEAVRNVQTWQFAAGTNATFTTTYTYEVEQRMTGASDLTRVELELPKRVRIVAPANGW